MVSVELGLRHRGGKRTNELCFVVGVKRKSDKVKRQLPGSILGVGIDVRVAPKPKWLHAICSGGDCACPEHVNAPGKVGILGQSEAKRFLVTAMHVLVRDDFDFDLESSIHKNAVVHGCNLGASAERLGKLVSGAFNSGEDIGLVRLDASIEPGALIDTTTIALKAPLPITPEMAADQVPIRLELPGDSSLRGRLLAWPTTLTVNTPRGSATLQNLAKFEIDSEAVRPGWSGSAIFMPDGQPLSLLSLGVDATDSDKSLVYGFPIAAHWNAWTLKTL